MKKIVIIAVLLFFTGCQEPQESKFYRNQQLIDYLHFAQEQYKDDNKQLFARIKGYLDASYNYTNTVNADTLFELMVTAYGSPNSPEQALLWLDDSYAILDGNDVNSFSNICIAIQLKYELKKEKQSGSATSLSSQPQQELASITYDRGNYDIDYDNDDYIGLLIDAFVQKNNNLSTKSSSKFSLLLDSFLNKNQSDVQAIQEIGDLKIDAYGPGIHMNKYGKPVRLWPDFGGVPGEFITIKPNAYGPGVHMDQYGRPVREYPWP